MDPAYNWKDPSLNRGSYPGPLDSRPVFNAVSYRGSICSHIIRSPLSRTIRICAHGVFLRKVKICDSAR